MIADYRESYELSKDPFASNDIYLSEALAQFVEKVAHLSQFSVGFVVISGERGAGKTVFAHHYWESLNQTHECCLLDAETHASADALLGTLVDYLALPAERDAGTGQLLAELRAFIHNEFDDLSVTVVIDNAHRLADQTLAALVSLLQVPAAHASAFRFVLMSESDLASRLDRFEMPDVLVQDLVMPQMGLADAVAMLNHRMSAAGFAGEPIFNEAQVEPLWRRADGNLHSLLDLAKLWLVEQAGTPSERSPDDTRPRRSSPIPVGLPLVHVVTVAALLAGLGMVYLYSAGEDAPAPGSEKGTDVALPAPVSSVSSSSVIALPPLSSSSDLSAASQTTRLASRKMAKTESPPEDSSAASAASSSAPVDASASESSSEPPLRPPEPSLSPDEREILSWAESDYSLQVLGVSSREAAQRYLDSQSNRRLLRVYRTQRQGEAWFVVIAGRYSNAAEARSAIDGLTATQKKAGPWARPVADLQEAIRSR